MHEEITMNDMIPLMDLKFNHQTKDGFSISSREVAMYLNKYKFAGRENWTFGENGVEITSTDNPVLYGSSELLRDILLRYLMCQSTLDRLLQGNKIDKKPDIQVNNHFEFAIMSSDEIFSDKNFSFMMPVEMFKFLESLV